MSTEKPAVDVEIERDVLTLIGDRIDEQSYGRILFAEIDGDVLHVIAWDGNGPADGGRSRCYRVTLSEVAMDQYLEPLGCRPGEQVPEKAP